MKKGKILLLMSLFLIFPLLMLGAAPQSRAFYNLTVGSQNIHVGSNSMSVSATWICWTNGSSIDVYVFTNAQYAWWSTNGHPTTAPAVYKSIGVYSGSFCVNLDTSEAYTVIFTNQGGSSTAYLADIPDVTFSATESCAIPAFELLIVLFGLLVVVGIYLQKSPKFNLL